MKIGIVLMSQGLKSLLFSLIIYVISCCMSPRTQEAINCYRTTLRLKPDHPHAYNNLGNAMKDRVRP